MPDFAWFIALILLYGYACFLAGKIAGGHELVRYIEKAQRVMRRVVQ
jgi:hypothetical protein